MGFIEVSVIIFVAILIFCIISIVISKRNYKRLLKAEMEEINRKERSRMRNWTAEDYRKYDYVMSIHRSRCNLTRAQVNCLIENTEVVVESRNFKPNKHIKRHSIR